MFKNQNEFFNEKYLPQKLIYFIKTYSWGYRIGNAVYLARVD